MENWQDFASTVARWVLIIFALIDITIKATRGTNQLLMETGRNFDIESGRISNLQRSLPQLEGDRPFVMSTQEELERIRQMIEADGLINRVRFREDVTSRLSQIEAAVERRSSIAARLAPQPESGSTSNGEPAQPTRFEGSSDVATGRVPQPLSTLYMTLYRQPVQPTSLQQSSVGSPGQTSQPLFISMVSFSNGEPVQSTSLLESSVESTEQTSQLLSISIVPREPVQSTSSDEEGAALASSGSSNNPMDSVVALSDEMGQTSGDADHENVVNSSDGYDIV